MAAIFLAAPDSTTAGSVKCIRGRGHHTGRGDGGGRGGAAQPVGVAALRGRGGRSQPAAGAGRHLTATRCGSLNSKRGHGGAKLVH